MRDVLREEKKQREGKFDVHMKKSKLLNLVAIQEG